MLREEGGHPLTSRRDTLRASRGHLADVRLFPETEVDPEAFAAPVLQTGAGAIEGGRRELESAPSAHLALDQHEHMFVYEPDGSDA